MECHHVIITIETTMAASGSGDSKPQMAESSSKTKPVKSLTQEQIVAGFQELRNQQRATVNKISELDMERKEHDLVIDALKIVDGSRKCYRMVGGVLVERTVGDVLPALIANHEQLGKILDALHQQLETKGRELQEYREKYNIRIRGEDEKASTPQDSTMKASGGGVLVAQDAS